MIFENFTPRKTKRSDLLYTVTKPTLHSLLKIFNFFIALIPEDNGEQLIVELKTKHKE